MNPRRAAGGQRGAGGPRAGQTAAARHRAREAALQILYQWEVGGAPIDPTIEAYWAARDDEAAEAVDAERTPAPPLDRGLAERLARGTAARVAELDPRIQAAAEHWRLARMAVIDRLILRIATYELRHEPDTPAAVVINEALELARTFSGDDAVRFVNGVLDAVARELRAGPA